MSKTGPRKAQLKPMPILHVHGLVFETSICKNKQLYSVNLRTAHYISNNLFDGQNYMDNRSNSRANTCVKSQLLREGMYLLDKKTNTASGRHWW